MSAWESIFFQSPVNGGCYEEDELTQQNWDWPKATWFQARLDQIRDHESVLNPELIESLVMKWRCKRHN